MFPESIHYLVANSTIASVNLKLSASDFLRISEKLVQSNKLPLYIHGGSAEGIKNAYNRLMKDAQVTDPFAENPFGLFGALQGKFGVFGSFMQYYER